jgi:DNA-binding PadR family transcriptional regulator
MPPGKGNLAATKAILSLFLAGPETQGNVRARLRREYADAFWSRSIVDYALPSLAMQGLIVLVARGEKRGDDVYEITERGVGEFKHWIRESSRAPAPIREPLQLWIEHSTPRELPALLAVIRESEIATRLELALAKRRFDSQRNRGSFGPPDNSEWKGRVRYAIHGDRVVYWQQRLARLATLRKLLKGERDLHQRAPADDHGGDRA